MPTGIRQQGVLAVAVALADTEIEHRNLRRLLTAVLKIKKPGVDESSGFTALADVLKDGANDWTSNELEEILVSILEKNSIGPSAVAHALLAKINKLDDVVASIFAEIKPKPGETETDDIKERGKTLTKAFFERSFPQDSSNRLTAKDLGKAIKQYANENWTAKLISGLTEDES